MTPPSSNQRTVLQELVNTAAEVYRISDRATLPWSALAAALKNARTVLATPDETPLEPDAEMKWRRLVAFTVGAHALYLDDGEMHDSSKRPFIDFLRDSPDAIARKIQERGLAALRDAAKTGCSE